LIKAQDTLELQSSLIWNTVTDLLPGQMILNKKLSYESSEYGTISQKEITQIMKDVFGANPSKRHDEGGRKLVFDLSKLDRIGKIYDMTVEIEVTSKDKDRTHRTHRTLVGLDKHSTDLSQNGNITDNESLSDISNNNIAQKNKEVTIEIQSSTVASSNNASEPSEPSELEGDFICYHCNNFQTNNKDYYESHNITNHYGLPAYPTIIDLQSHGLQAQGKSWEI
jgi:hypothetical protein